MMRVHALIALLSVETRIQQTKVQQIFIHVQTAQMCGVGACERKDFELAFADRSYKLWLHLNYLQTKP